jgi:hypothetical protein
LGGVIWSYNPVAQVSGENLVQLMDERWWRSIGVVHSLEVSSLETLLGASVFFGPLLMTALASVGRREAGRKGVGYLTTETSAFLFVAY